MRVLLQVLTVVVVGATAWFVIRGQGARHQAIRRVLMLGFVAAAASSVFFPQLWSRAAHLVGVGRGTDLLLYLLVLTFFAFVASTYRRFRHMESQITQLARRLALLSEAAPPEKN